VLWCGTPPLFVAAQNGQIGALKFYVEECMQDIGMVDSAGNNILKHIEFSTNWRQMEDHVECRKYVGKGSFEETKEVTWQKVFVF
jgi:hypothetical protein